MDKLFKRLTYYLIGSAILSLGISLSLRSELGAGAFDALYYNLSKLVNIKPGTSMYIAIFMVYIITMILKPRKIYIVGYLLTGVVSAGVNIWLEIISKTTELGIQVFFFGSAVVLLPLGVTFIIQSKLPLSPMDNLLVILVEKTKGSVALIKTSIETSFAVTALIFGFAAGIGVGALSLGTIIITFVIGPGIGFYMKFIKEIDVKRLANK
ncbi:YczE/YyaS/YitT family protein [Haloplasma contractile]|uniref:Membrane protein YczE n=1 Tax=Haloplasma contractile SSD-17B TaxID=1033810 RepID=F7PTN4_9MOLU|nr:hypothetical protein [Haloplasma contractile]ERJ12200.1 hypothetical protein HLPCO_001727 [Haloplasma contractile SSD-17B]